MKHRAAVLLRAAGVEMEVERAKSNTDDDVNMET